MSARRGGWECGECGGWWPQAVPTCIDCLNRDRDGAVSALAVMCRQRDQLRAAIRHVVDDSPGTPDSVKRYLSRAVLDAMQAVSLPAQETT